ncbi:hypothetical protein [Salinivibrio sp. SS2]|uniref:hypothetical protein n=1 Tax=Salinivibrio sp. SS2 TaxID=1892894 RepID=UPI001C30E3CB|nr:hypothetical protein [Salinivibrio sp. DV]
MYLFIHYERATQSGVEKASHCCRQSTSHCYLSHYLSRNAIRVVRKKASPKHAVLVDAFLQRIDEILPWDKAAVDATTAVKRNLMNKGKGTPIGGNDTAIAGHAIATGCVLVTNNTREFQRVEGLKLEDWA